MRVLLVQAFTAVDMELVYPLGLAYLASAAPEHEIRIFDLNLHRDRPFEALEQEARAFRPQAIGVSFRNMKVGMPHLHTDDFEPQRRAVQKLRAVCPDVPVIGGGTAFSLYAIPMLERLPEIDVGFWGEGEDRFPLLLRHLREPWRVPGVYYRTPEGIRFSGSPDPVDFTRLPAPRRDLVPVEPYARSSFVSVGVQTKRGCSLRCLHCSDTYLTGKRLRLRAPSEVVDEMEGLHREHGVDQMFVCDQIFNIPPEHAIDICREIVRRKLDIKWSAWFNEHRNALPDDLIVWLKRAGCGLLSFSPDHVDDRMLRRLDKNFTEADLHYTYRLARRFDMDVEYSFFLNAPGEDWRSLLRILVFLARARAHLGPRLRMFSLLLMQPIRIYPHTRIRELAIREGLLQPDDDLIEGRYWNPEPLNHAVTAIQAGAEVLYRSRKAVRTLRGRTFDSVVRDST